jgi:DNA-binding NarL/FixJ family response regulator
MKSTVLIVDDHAGFRASARRVLEAEGFEVVGEAADGESGIVSARSLRPEIVLLDVQLPGIDGFSVARELSRDQAAPVVVLTSTRSGSDFGSLVAESGARGFVPKSALSGQALRGLIG